MGTNFSCGVNFASSGSSVLPPTMINFNPISLNIQFLQFLEFKSKSTLISKQGLFPRALYTIDIGQNDIAHAYVLNMTQVEIKLFIPSILDKLSMTIKDIYGEGGRFFWIHNTAPLGCLPYLLDRIPPTQDQMDKTGCSNPVNEVAQFFNSRLNETVVQLRRDLPSATFTYVDIYSVKYKLISQATQYGFEHPLQACCGRGGGKYNYDRFGRCFENVKGLRSCSDPSTRISFDGIHFTEAANRWIFERISGGAFSDPSTSLINACQQ
ncbi:GDSL esterase/lipase [Acorus calamus]|uniref:GDSL esterase/lipase n=1 Tax=Acorus calamus TaxID=4465 RepID=A0AAV9EYV8_ACOCL|nr:GDSL esterase/lipase [Acorus calamus]